MKPLFDTRRLRHHKNLGRRWHGGNDFLLRYVEAAFLDRLTCFSNTFSRILILGDVTSPFKEAFQKSRPGSHLYHGAGAASNRSLDCVCEEEALPFPAQSFDLVVSCLGLHLLNAPQQALGEMRRVLRPGGLFLASFLGGQTLAELRTLLLEEEVRLTGGAHQRLAPLIESTTASALLQHSGFQEPLTESETLTVSFKDLARLRVFLKAWGAQAPLYQRAPLLPKELVPALGDLYRNRYPSPEGGLLATFEILSFTGWRP